MQTQKQGVTVD